MDTNILQTLEEMQIEHDREIINEMLPTVESWVTVDNKNFFFSFKCVDTIPPGLFSMTYNDSQGYGLTKMEYKSEDFFNLPSLPVSYTHLTLPTKRIV